MYSVIVPVKNEELNIEPQLREISAVMRPIGQLFEILYIDDGSTDRSWEILRAAQQTYPELRLLRLDRNHGQSAATDAGIRYAHGEVLITLDGDMQNDPRDIPAMLAKIGEADMVCGYRARRNDSWWRKVQSRIANRIRNSLTGDTIRDTGCSLKVFRRVCFDQVKFFNGMHRFMPTLARLEGYKIDQVPVNHRPRERGKTKYNFGNRALVSLKDLLAVRWMQRRHLAHRVAEDIPARASTERQEATEVGVK